ncbi:hypothetical protein GWK08_08510 [Leptobacterium flavescens]|uniref:DUF2268 domain-containing protein n=1 Tax=Leptobacterium flavescens TaxID=472055 RepID=A0A6P0UJK0_9FLAO|nr:hypothetical protein [Leptobacterium flavescens]NER13475.1 hypothetical protein [Leptobacterium flavescens]
MKKITIVTFVIILLILSCKSPNKKDERVITGTTTIVRSGVENQKISREWLEALRTRESKTYRDSIAELKRPLSEGELEWQQLIESITGEWDAMRDSINVPFGKLGISDTIYVLLGYRGRDDAFTYKDRTMCLDLTALNDNYGSAGDSTNKDRIMRIMSHEYTHLLSKKWMDDNDFEIPANHYASDTAFRKHILWEIWYEGFGVYRSMSPKWFPKGDSLSPIAKKTLEKLSPVFTDKIITMDTTKALTLEQKKWIQEKVSRAPFREKYAALPVGIWLALESKGNDKNLSVWVNKGPEGILGLAKKHLKGENKKKFDAVFHDRFKD